MKKIVLFLLLIAVAFPLFSQSSDETKSYGHQLEIRHDNDFFLFTDRYYSSGLFISFRTQLEKGLFGTSEQLSFQLRQEVYTPSQTQSMNSDLFDRPYVGFTGFWTTWSMAKQNELFKVGAMVGIAGLNSGAGGFQRWFHRTLSITDSPLWVDELENSFHLNVYFSYIKEWELEPNPFGIRIAILPEVALGSRDVYAGSDMTFHFGRRNSIGNSIAFERLGTGIREIYFALWAGYRQVIYNGLIEGNLFGDDSPVLREAKNSILRFGFDMNHRCNQNDYKIGIRYNTKETPNSKSHVYLQLSYALSW